GSVPGEDLLLGAEQEQGAAQTDAVAGAEPADLHDVAVDPGAVGALQVGEDDLGVVALDLGVVAANALVVETEQVALFPANGHRGAQVAEDAALVNPFQYLKGDRRHRLTPRCPAHSW